MKQVVAIFLVAALVVVGIVFVKPDVLEMNKTEPQGESEVVENGVEETIEDGVYINHTYGFRFEYDENIFNGSNPWEKRDQKMFYAEGQRFPQLSVRYLSKDFYEAFYGECFNAVNGSIFAKSEERNSASRKLYNLENICVSIAVPYNEKHPEEPWNYTLVVPARQSNGGYVSIYLSGESLSKTVELRDQFDSIAESFEFIK